MTTQLNVRLPDPVIEEINELAEAYGSQAKVIIAAVSKLSEEIKMARKFYAAENSYGVDFTYASDGWFVHAFSSRAERDAWVEADTYPNGNPTREPVDAKTAPKIRSRDRWIEH